jgi:hypothetical protein
MEAVRTSEKSVYFNKTALRYFPVVYNLKRILRFSSEFTAVVRKLWFT